MTSRLYDALMRLAAGDETAISLVTEITGVGQAKTEPGETPAFAPLDCSKPEFSSLSADQLSYYLWWREAWLMGEDVAVDSGYSLILAFQLLDGHLGTLGLESVQQLERLASAQSDRGAARKLILWAADLAWELGYDKKAAGIYERFRPGLLPGVAEYMGTSEGWSSSEVTRIARETVPPSRFMEVHRRRVVRLFREALKDGDRWFRSKHGMWLADALGRRAGKPYTPYKHALMSRSVKSRPLQEVDVTPSAMPFLLDFLKNVENVLRLAMGYKPLRRVGSLPDIVQEYVCQRGQAWPTIVDVKTAALTKARTSVKLRRGVLRRLTVESAKVLKLTSRWVELGDKPYGPGTIFDGLTTEETSNIECMSPLGALLSEEVSGDLRNGLVSGPHDCPPNGMHDGLHGGLRSDMEDRLSGSMQDGLHGGLRSDMEDLLYSDVENGLHKSIHNGMCSGMYDNLQSGLHIPGGMSANASDFVRMVYSENYVLIEEASLWARGRGELLTDIIDEVNLAYFDELDGTLLDLEDDKVVLTAREVLRWERP